MMGALVIALPGAAILGLTLAWFGSQRITTQSFFLAKREIGVLVGAISIPICWTWANTLVIGPQKAYQGGLAPYAWFDIDNVLALVAFAVVHFARLRFWRDSKAGTLPGLVRERFGDRMMGIYTFVIGVVCVYAVAGQLIGTLVLLHHATGIDNGVLVIVLAGSMLAIALWRGVESVISVADMVKAMAIFFVVFIALILWVRLGGVHTYAAIRSGVASHPQGFFDWGLLRDFALPLAISWISGGMIDHQLWQRSFSLSPRASRLAPVLGIVPFALIVAIISSLGFIAADMGAKLADPQLAGFAAVGLYGRYGELVFTVMIATALFVTSASALNAGANMWALDIVPRWKPEWSPLAISRVAMVAILACGVGLALSGVTLEKMALFIGSFRGALLFPTLLVFFLPSRGGRNAVLETSVVTGMIIGPIVAYLSAPLWGGLAVLAITGIGMGHEVRRARA